MNAQNRFRFFSDNLVVISKAKDKDGKEVMRLGGIASTNDQDSDGETLDPYGFDTSYLESSGVVNWHHGAKNNPDTIIGEPTKVELTNKGLYMEVDLYPDSKLAKAVYGLAQVLEKNSKTRHLGFSIEGNALDRDPLDKKKIRKAAITGVAVTHMPKNPFTFAKIIKGEVALEETLDPDMDKPLDPVKEEKNLRQELNKAKVALADEILKGKKDEEPEEAEEEESEKALTTTSGAPVTREHVDGQEKTLTKAKIYERIFSDFPGISLSKAKSIHKLIQHVATMSKRPVPTEQDIEKAFKTFGVEPELTLEKCVQIGREFLEKGGTQEELEKDLLLKGVEDDMIFQTVEELNKGKEAKADETADDEGEEQGDNKPIKKAKKGGDDGDDDEEDEGAVDADKDGKKEPGEEVFMKKGDGYKKLIKKGREMEECEGTYMKKADGNFELVKAEEASADDAIVKALENVQTQQTEQGRAIGTILQKAISDISDIKDRVNNMEGQSQGRKSAPSSRYLEKGFTDGEADHTGASQVSASRQRGQVLNVLEKAAFDLVEKGQSNSPDPEFEKAMMLFESTGQIDSRVVQRLRLERNVIITA